MTGNSSKSLGVELRVSKESYRAVEPVFATVVLRNKSDSELTINKRMGLNPKAMAEGTWEVKFDIAFPPGERPVMGTLVNRGKPRERDFTQLQPGGEFTESFVLNRFHSMELPGTYEIRVTYHNSDDGARFGVAAWTGEITSTPVKLRVTA